MAEILIHCRALETPTAGVTLGLALAKRLGARADGLYIAALYPGAFASPETVALTIMAVKREFDNASAAAPWWSEQLAAHRLEGAWRVAEGETVECLCHAARWSDLVVVERSVVHPEAPIGFGMVSRAVFASGLPLLVVPEASGARECGRTVVVAWNGSRESARALRGALPILARAEQVIVLDGEADAPDESVRRLPPLPWQEFVARAGLRVDARAFPARHGEAGPALLDAAHSLGADLVVMGAWGHSRIAELILGGTTRYMFGHSDVPLLVAH
jgi:nucleotide-binding universal stress UspA family protein